MLRVRIIMYFLSNRLLCCYETTVEMDELARTIIEVAFKERYNAAKALSQESDEEHDKQFMRWARARQVREVPNLFEIINRTARKCHGIVIDSRRWEQFRQWRQDACTISIQTDTISSVYFTFMHWNAHTLPKRRQVTIVTPCSAIQEHAVHIPAVRIPVVQCQRENVIDQRVRQSAPTMRFPRRSHAYRPSSSLM